MNHIDLHEDGVGSNTDNVTAFAVAQNKQLTAMAIKDCLGHLAEIARTGNVDSALLEMQDMEERCDTMCDCGLIPIVCPDCGHQIAARIANSQQLIIVAVFILLQKKLLSEDGLLDARLEDIRAWVDEAPEIRFHVECEECGYQDYAPVINGRLDLLVMPSMA